MQISDEDNDGIDEYGMSSLERKQMKQAMAESRYTGYVEDELRRNPSRDSGPYMQSMIDTIAEVGPGVKGPSGYQIGAHCIDLMLEDIGKMRSIKATIDEAKRITSFIYNTKDRELLRPGITRFATEYIVLESLIRHQMELRQLCTCDEWRTFNNTARRRNEASQVSEIVLTERFWKKARECCAVMEPLVRVLKAVDQDKKPTLCIIYEAMDRAKMTIKASVRKWEKYWEIIDDRWYRQLHRHLHAAKVRRGVKEVIKRLEPDLIVQSNAINEIRLFVDKLGEFGSPLARQAVSTSLPAQWWYNYGDEAPNLRKIAVKEWTRETEEPMLPENDLDWLDEEGRMDNVPNDEDDDASLPLSRWSVPRSSKGKGKHVSSKEKGKQVTFKDKSAQVSSSRKDKHVLHSSSRQNDSDEETAEDDDNDDDDDDDDDDDGDDDGDNDGDGNVHKETQQSHGMTWAQGEKIIMQLKTQTMGTALELRIYVDSYPI
ncbi:hypothetical protein Sango_2677800 [Sesamum angolense]|uniref:Uncharacterized protein n=1 Tax=Sesamum angolense TaxID=2727404 RepID=A0AAE1W2H8_9LAMI|nr:hypothetical protein Sango_2677800 [Sesamum angolense]